MGISVIIFSKNRPAQLELLLRSMKKYYDSKGEIDVIVKTNNYEGYDKLVSEYWDYIGITAETNLKEQLLILMVHEYTMFLCDDCVFIREFDTDMKEVKQFEQDPGILCVSLRLAPSINYCYAYKANMRLPEINNGIWKWKGADGDWGYPMSLDGHIFRTKEIKPIIEKLSFKNPNQLEGALAGNYIDKPRMICFKSPRLINMPLNKVQTENNNRCSNKYPVEELNKKYMEGYKIKIPPAENYNSVHVERDIEWA